MLFRTIHIPAVYTLPPSGGAHELIHCSLLLLILEGFVGNGLILVDETGQIRKAISDAVQNWPPDYRKKGEEILIQLDKRNRFVGVSTAEDITPPACPEPLCQLALKIAQSEDFDLCLAKLNCSDCMSLPGAVDPLSYSATGAIVAILNRGSVVLNDGEWDKTLFEANVLYPVLRHAKHVKIIDRWVGRSLEWKGGTFRIAENYARALQWIFEQFVTTVGGRYTSGFEVFCGIRDRDCHGHAEDAAQTLKRWAADRTNEFGYPMTIHVKLEVPTQEMRHDRYLITDQVAIHVGRGIDLLQRDCRHVRDVTLGIIQDPGKIETEVKNLKEIF